MIDRLSINCDFNTTFFTPEHFYTSADCWHGVLRHDFCPCQQYHYRTALFAQAWGLQLAHADFTKPRGQHLSTDVRAEAPDTPSSKALLLAYIEQDNSNYVTPQSIEQP